MTNDAAATLQRAHDLTEDQADRVLTVASLDVRSNVSDAAHIQVAIDDELHYGPFTDSVKQLTIDTTALPGLWRL